MLLLPKLIFNQMAKNFVIVKLYVVMQWLNFNSKRRATFKTQFICNNEGNTESEFIHIQLSKLSNLQTNNYHSKITYFPIQTGGDSTCSNR